MNPKPKVAIVLAGCGVQDGSEIHEAVLTMLALDRLGATYQCFAPDIAQHDVIDHRSGQEMEGERRNALVEAARIARGAVKELSVFRPAEFDALIIPGGFGVAKTLSSFALDGPDCHVLPALEKAVRGMAQAGKPIGALCIAPAVVARILGDGQVTIGSDAGVAAAIEKMGGRHKEARHGQVVVDEKMRLVTAPCYMLDATIAQVAEGAEAVARAVLELARQPQAA